MRERHNRPVFMGKRALSEVHAPAADSPAAELESAAVQAGQESECAPLPHVDAPTAAAVAPPAAEAPVDAQLSLAVDNGSDGVAGAHSGLPPPPAPPERPKAVSTVDTQPASAHLPSEAVSLRAEVNALRTEIAGMEAQLASRQQEHSALTQELSTIELALPKSRPPHDSSWQAATNPANGAAYYYNRRTGVSTYERPPDYNPRPRPELPPGASVKGPPGSNLFVVRKMRRGEVDDFDEFDMREAFSRFGSVLRCEVNSDAQTGLSKGFGFVSMSSPEEATRALQALNGAWIAGREMKVERTKEDASGR